jgi:hypothetical protein
MLSELNAFLTARKLTAERCGVPDVAERCQLEFEMAEFAGSLTGTDIGVRISCKSR